MTRLGTVLRRVNRVVMAVSDRQEAASGWVEVLGAEHDHDDRLDAWNALRSRYRVGTGWVDLLEPDGAGPVFDAVHSRGSHLFAGGVTTTDLDALVARLRSAGLEPVVERGEVLLDEAGTGGHGLRLVVGADEVKTQLGHLQHFYEITNLVDDAPGAVAAYADLFGLSPSDFVPIDSSHYGYRGTLALFRPDHLDRIEVITPGDSSKTMGRYFGKNGESLYMMFAECHALAAVEANAEKHGAGYTIERDRDGAHTIFLHPESLGGMMLGLSRSTYAWNWSGAPERVERS